MSTALPPLRLGTCCPEVGNWQRYLNSRGFRDADGHSLTIDERFGLRTEYATENFQRQRDLPVSGSVDLLSRSHACLDGFIPFIQAKYCTLVSPAKPRPLTLIVIHTMENKEKPSAAEDVALWFAGLSKMPPPRASAHYCVDEDSVVQCVRVRDVAWQAEGANRTGIGIEHAGTAKQSKEDWADGASLAILARSACLAADLLREHKIPLRKLTPTEVREGQSGFCGHYDVNLAFPPTGENHWDPGPSFPWTDYLAMIQERT